VEEEGSSKEKGEERKEEEEEEEACFYVCTLCHKPYPRDFSVLSHIEFKHWAPDWQPKECYTKLSLSTVIHKLPSKVRIN
jgi:hypothetical protein